MKSVSLGSNRRIPPPAHPRTTALVAIGALDHHRRLGTLVVKNILDVRQGRAFFRVANQRRDSSDGSFAIVQEVWVGFKRRLVGRVEVREMKRAFRTRNALSVAAWVASLLGQKRRLDGPPVFGASSAQPNDLVNR